MAGLVAIGLFAALLAAATGIMRTSDAYRDSVALARTTPAVIEEMGTPIREGFFAAGSIVLQNDRGEANLVIPLKGPQSDARLEVIATKKAGKWHYKRRIVRIEKTGHAIDLSDQEK